MNLARVNLNLLLCLYVLLKTRHVTKAGECLGITQSAVSNNLSQLREIFNDKLLVRGPDGMVPTPAAIAMQSKLHQVIMGAKCIFGGPVEFDPKTTERTFRIGMSDLAEYQYLPELIKRVRVEAPNIDIKVKHYNQFSESMPFRSGDIELGIGLITQADTQLKKQVLFADTACCLMHPDNPLADKDLTMQEYLDAKTIAIVFQNQGGTVLDNSLLRMGKKRNIILSIPHIFPVFRIIEENPDMIVSIPKRLAVSVEKRKGYVIKDLPFVSDSCDICMVWHRRVDDDPAHKWLRDFIADIVV